MSNLKTLITKDAKGKIRVAEFDYEWYDPIEGYLITRITYQMGGKRTSQPSIEITEGKAKRTIHEQVELKFNSLIKEKLDKGYKELDNPIDTYTHEELDNIVGSNKTDSSGIMKPMNAKQADKITNKKTFDKKYKGSRKIDGLKCIIYMGEDGELHTVSRGSTNYDNAMYEIISNPTLIKMFNNNPGLIMDGEVYKHGLSLQQINSIARTVKKAVDYEVLQYYWYDIVDTKTPFEERNKRMESLAKEYNIGWDPEREFKDGELRVQLVPQVDISGWDNMLKLHNDYVSEGWEGLVIKLVTAVYGPGKRTNDCIKIKMYKDAEFEIVGYELGLRGNEDMCFRCITTDGKEFLAKPWGDKALKDWYIENFQSECLGKMATVKYFYLSDEGTPLQPSVKCIRLDSDINK